MIHNLPLQLILAYLLGDFGDYCTQSDWMASEKTKKSVAALVHAIVYTLPFLLVTMRPEALLIIGGSHFIIDRWRLARHLCWLKNFLGPRQTMDAVYWHPWSECSGTGYHNSKPPWLTVWLMIKADNTVHAIINILTVYAFAQP